MARLGTANDAARFFGLGLSAFNSQRSRGTYVLDVSQGSLEPVVPGALTRAEMSARHLVAPAFHGSKRPGGRWEYDLDAIASERSGYGIPYSVGEALHRSPPAERQGQ